MKKCCLLLLLCAVVIFVSIYSCYNPVWKPDHVTTVKLPIDGVFYTVESYYGRGAIAPDVTRVYAHLERAGKTIKALVLQGEDLSVKITWGFDNPRTVTFCFSGFTGIFQNQVTLSVGGTPGSSVTMHHNIMDCKSIGCFNFNKCCGSD